MPITKSINNQGLLFIPIINLRRILIVILLGLLLVFRYFASDFPFYPLLILLIITIILEIIFSYLHNNYGWTFKIVYWEFVFDTLLLITLCHYSGGIESIFQYLIIVSILEAALVLDDQEVYFLITYFNLAYIVLLILDSKGIIPHISPFFVWMRAETYLSFSAIWLSLTFTALITVGTGIFFNYLATISYNLKQTNEQLAKSELSNRLMLIQIQEKERQLAAIFESITDGIAVLGYAGEIISLNYGLSHFLDGKEEDFIGKNIYEISDVFTKLCPLEKLSQIFNTNKQSNFRCELAKAAGIIEYYELSLFSLVKDNNEIENIILLLRNITSQQKLQKQLNQLEQLATLGHLSANMAHKIRNPLLVIRGSAETLQQEVPIPLKDQELIQFIIEETNRLNRLIENLIIFAQPSEPQAQYCSFKPILEQIIENFQDVEVKWNLEDNLPELFVDPTHLEQILKQIISNALDKPSTPITIEAYKNGNENITIIIIDKGKGIESEKLAQIFDPFYTDKINGSGLGLSIVKNLITLNNGTVHIESILGEETKVILNFPNYFSQAEHKETQRNTRKQE